MAMIFSVLSVNTYACRLQVEMNLKRGILNLKRVKLENLGEITLIDPVNHTSTSSTDGTFSLSYDGFELEEGEKKYAHLVFIGEGINTTYKKLDISSCDQRAELFPEEPGSYQKIKVKAGDDSKMNKKVEKLKNANVTLMATYPAEDGGSTPTLETHTLIDLGSGITVKSDNARAFCGFGGDVSDLNLKSKLAIGNDLLFDIQISHGHSEDELEEFRKAYQEGKMSDEEFSNYVETQFISVGLDTAPVSFFYGQKEGEPVTDALRASDPRNPRKGSNCMIQIESLD